MPSGHGNFVEGCSQHELITWCKIFFCRNMSQRTARELRGNNFQDKNQYILWRKEITLFSPLAYWYYSGFKSFTWILKSECCLVSSWLGLVICLDRAMCHRQKSCHRLYLQNLFLIPGRKLKMEEKIKNKTLQIAWWNLPAHLTHKKRWENLLYLG